jgi:hypothetical protein
VVSTGISESFGLGYKIFAVQQHDLVEQAEQSNKTPEEDQDTVNH